MKKLTYVHQVYLALGSNLGNRHVNLDEAITRIAAFMTVKQASPVYETEPWGYLDQPRFLNQVIEGETRLTPGVLLKRLKVIEKDMGRQAGIRYGPRLIDLDILFYDDLVTDRPGLTIPHPRLHERAFVLIPLDGIAADFIHPVLQQTIHELTQKVDSTGVKLLSGVGRDRPGHPFS